MKIKHLFQLSQKSKKNILAWMQKFLNYKTVLNVEDIEIIHTNIYIAPQAMDKLTRGDLRKYILDALVFKMMQKGLIEIQVGQDMHFGNHVVRATSYFIPRKLVPESVKFAHYSLENQQNDKNPLANAEEENNNCETPDVRKIDESKK